MATLLCIALSHPFANSGFDDDWSYTDVAYRFAQTGHFHYSGWGSPSIIFQSFWAAFWIKVFGFSFDLVRAVTIPFSLAFVVLTYLLSRMVGLSREFALFASLILGVSPLYVPLASSFMTEPYACALTLLGIYAAICAADARDVKRARNWLWVLAAASILGGSDRQSVWAMPISLIPFLLYRRRRERVFVINGLVALTACLISLIVAVKFFSPVYAPTAMPRNELLRILFSKSLMVVHGYIVMFLVALFLSLPAFLAESRLWKVKQIGLAAVTSVPLLLILKVRSVDLVPFLGTVLTSYGVMPLGINGLGLKPLLLSIPVRHALTYLFLVVASLWTFQVWHQKSSLRLPRTAAIVFLLSVAAYLPVLLPGVLTTFIYDRYVLPLLPLLIIWVLASVQATAGKISALAWIGLLIFAAYAVVTSHDYYADLRARAIAGDDLRNRGVASRYMSIGFEYDAWTQVRTAGRVGTVMYNLNPVRKDFWFWYFSTEIEPNYVAFASAADAPVKNQILEVPFTAWTSPFRRKISILKYADLPYGALDRNAEY